MRVRKNWKWLTLGVVTAGALLTILLTTRFRRNSDGVIYVNHPTAKGRYAKLTGNVSKIDNCLFLTSDNDLTSRSPVLLVWPRKTKVLRIDGHVTVSLDNHLLRVPGPANLGGSIIDKSDPIIPKRLSCDVRHIKSVFLVGSIHER